MPTYDYICENCGHEFEQFQTIKARPMRKCPRCGKASLKRLIGVGAGIIFKGSGFYQTDYRSESYKKAAESEKLVGAEPGGARNATSKDTEKKESKSSSSRRRPPPEQGEKTKPATKDKKKSA